MTMAVTLRAGPGEYSGRLVKRPGAIGSRFASAAPGPNADPSNRKNATGWGFPFCTMVISFCKVGNRPPRWSVATMVNSTSVVPARKTGVDVLLRGDCNNRGPQETAAAARCSHPVTVEYRLQPCNFLVPARHTRAPMQDRATQNMPPTQGFSDFFRGFVVAETRGMMPTSKPAASHDPRRRGRADNAVHSRAILRARGLRRHPGGRSRVRPEALADHERRCGHPGPSAVGRAIGPRSTRTDAARGALRRRARRGADRRDRGRSRPKTRSSSATGRICYTSGSATAKSFSGSRRSSPGRRRSLRLAAARGA